MLKNIVSLIKNTKILFILLLCVNLCVILYHFSYKKGFHSDEQWSYAHANSSQGAFLDKEIDSYYKINDNIRERLFNKYIDSSILKTYLTIQNEEAFEYNNIYKNLTQDVHPPLYMILIHTISSFFPDSFSKWYAGSINLCAFIFIYIMLFKLAKLMLKDEKLALCSVALWGFSEIGIDTIIFLRMYVLQTLWGICLVYQTQKILENNNATKKDLFLIFLYSFLGIFTQYNSIFFSFFVTVITCFTLLKQNKYKMMFTFGSVMLLSFLMLFVIFPQAFDVLFNSMRSKQVMSIAMAEYTNNSDDIIFEILFLIEQRLVNILGIIFEHFLSFNNINNHIISFAIIIILTIILYIRPKIKKETLYLLSICLFYFIYLFNMPYMHIFHSRYYMCLMPFIAILFVIAITNILSHMNVKKGIIIAILSLLIALNFVFMNFNKNSSYSFLWGKREYDIYEKIKNREVFIDKGYNFIWLHSMVYYLANAKKIFITEEICDDIALNQIIKSSSPIVLTYSSYIRTPYEGDYNECLKKMGLKKISKICPSQHCYNVWIKEVNND